MIIAKLIGGLGNQMFQYSAGKSLAVRNNTELKMDISGFKDQSSLATPRVYALNVFNIQENFASNEEIGKFKNNSQSKNVTYIQKIIAKIFDNTKGKYFIEPKFSFNSEMLALKKNVFLDGYWQTEKYFKKIEDVICKEFTLKEEFSVEDKKIVQEIKNSNSISLHIRRGDYVADLMTNKFHGICSLEYYAEAVKYIAKKVENPVFYIFSDDIEWVKDNFKIDFPMKYISDGILKDYEELILMSYCKHNIIANSSFSWWGAWLNKNHEKIVIAPKQWFAKNNIDTSDLILETWIRL